jgi:hypothetical protein
MSNVQDDIVCLPLKVARSLGNINPIVLCVKVSNLLHFIDPLTLQSMLQITQYFSCIYFVLLNLHSLFTFVLETVAELNSTLYWHNPFRALLNRKGLTEFYVIDVEPVTTSHQQLSYYQQQQQQQQYQHQQTKTKWQLVDVTVTRVIDRSTGQLDPSGTQYVTRSHLGMS